MGDDDKSTQNSQGGTFVLFILWIVVLTNSSKSNFNLLDKESYYELVQFNTYGYAAIFTSLLLIACFGMTAVMSEKDCCARMTGVIGIISGLGIIGILIAQLVMLGGIMHNDIEHTFIGYKAFWSEGVMNFSINEPVIPTSNHTRRLSAIHFHSAVNYDVTPRIRGANISTPPLSKSDYHRQMLSYYQNDTMPTNSFAKWNVLYLVNDPVRTDPVYHLEMARYYKKVPMCVFTNDCDSTALNSIYHTMEYNYNNYWKKYHHDLFLFYTKGVFPTHLLSQAKVGINEFLGAIQYPEPTTKPTVYSVQNRRRLLESNTKHIITSHWPYIMADVLVRITTGSIFLFCIIAAFFLSVGVFGWAVTKCC
jgi:hypothetical protein